jgi:S-adenosylmethionine hydrolase
MGKIVTLTTDFGARDSYVGALKGALLSIDPGAMIVDITHGIEPGNVAEGAFVIAGACSHYPPGTIHVGVVDPGVGTGRKAILIETEKHLFVGPDNGLFTYALAGVLSRDAALKAINLTENRYFRASVSPTFHGRDIFAPVAGHLSLGVAPEAFGPVIDTFVSLASPTPNFVRDATGSTLSGEVIHIDSFGNCISSIKEADIGLHFKGVEPALLQVVVKSVEMSGLCHTYGDCSKGGPVALIGSSGFLEVALSGGNGARELGIGIGERVSVVVGATGKMAGPYNSGER